MHNVRIKQHVGRNMIFLISTPKDLLYTHNINKSINAPPYETEEERKYTKGLN